MFLRLIACFAALSIMPTPGFSKTINLRNSCEVWEHIPASESLNSPAAAFLQCNTETGTWMSILVMCFTDTAEIEFRYRPGYPIISPIPPASDTDTKIDQPTETGAETEDGTPASLPLGKKEMLFFNFPKRGVTSVVKYDFNAGDWSYREKEPLAPLFSSLISGNFADVAFLATGITERLPLRGSTKALGPVVEACRIAKIKLDKAAEQVSED